MRLMKAFVLAAVCFIIFSSAPAFAWNWPILGFGGPCPGFVGGPSPILPGTPEWALQPTCGAQLLPFGYPYGTIQGSLNVGFMPLFGGPCPGGSGLIGK
jgi:hypothetical protein